MNKSSISVDSVVVLSILDSYMRRDEGEELVVGTLLGRYSNRGKNVEITRSFAVPIIRADDQISLNMEYHRSMLELQTRMSPSDYVVGWYMNGKNIDAITPLLNENYALECGDKAPILLLVNPSFEDNEEHLRVFRCNAIGGFDDDTPRIGASFVPCGFTVKDGANEEDKTKVVISGNSGSTLADLEKSTSMLKAFIEDSGSYIQDVLSGKVKGDSKRFNEFMNVLSTLPTSYDEKIIKSIEQNKKDSKMISDLAKLIRSQIALSEKLQTSQ